MPNTIVRASDLRDKDLMLALEKLLADDYIGRCAVCAQPIRSRYGRKPLLCLTCTHRRRDAPQQEDCDDTNRRTDHE